LIIIGDYDNCQLQDYISTYWLPYEKSVHHHQKESAGSLGNGPGLTDLVKRKGG
jgi:hypothetical protein